VSKARPLLTFVIWYVPARVVGVPLGVTIRWYPWEALVATGTVIDPLVTG
jgi:hypothetical protein